jgi:purine-cytosine permease-like protein
MNTTQKITQKTNKSINVLALFASTGTLICCALPITLVSLGMGAAVISLTSNFPFLMTLSEHKFWVFSVSGLLLFAGWLTYRRDRACPVDPAQAEVCQRSQKWNRRILLASVVIWGIGFFAAFLALPLRQWFDS